MGQFVDKTLDGKSVGKQADATPGAGGDGQFMSPHGDVQIGDVIDDPGSPRSPEIKTDDPVGDLGEETGKAVSTRLLQG